MNFWTKSLQARPKTWFLSLFCPEWVAWAVCGRHVTKNFLFHWLFKWCKSAFLFFKSQGNSKQFASHRSWQISTLFLILEKNFKYRYLYICFPQNKLKTKSEADPSCKICIFIYSFYCTISVHVQKDMYFVPSIPQSKCCP